MSLLFVDQFCPKAYDYTDLEEGSMGGTEATMLRVAEGLARSYGVSVLQHNREEEKYQKDVYFITMNSPMVPPDTIVLMRTAAHAPIYKSLYPEAKVYVWMHDLCGEVYKEELTELETVDGIIYVSNFHKTQFEQTLKGFKYDIKLPQGHVIYNIVDRYEANNEPFEHNPNQLIFASSPHKGLKEVLHKFKKLRGTAEGKNLQLGLLNPGYIDMEEIEEKDGVKVFGVKSHKELNTILRSSALLFYPQTVFPETFGLVLAEANAVYTQVVAHNFGAAREVLTDSSQAFDCTNDKKVIEKTLETLNRRDIQRLGPKKEFMVEEVLKSWEALLGQNIG